MSHHQVSVTLQDVEINVLAKSVRVSLSLTGRDTAEFTIRGTLSQPEAGQKVGIFDQGIRIFGGTIESADLTPLIASPGAEAGYHCVCTGWQHRLERLKLEAIAFHNKTAGEIVEDLLDYATTRFDEETHKGEIQAGATPEDLGTRIFRGLSIWEAIQDLAQESGYVAYVDPDLFVHFVSRDFEVSTVLVDSSTKNYRAPRVRFDRADYFNAASVAISLEAFAPFILDVQGDASHPTFDVYDPDDPFKVPLPIETIRAIKLNGVDQDFGIFGTDQSKVLYYTPGRATIQWDDAQPVPSPEDVITVEFWQVGQNVITVEDSSEIIAVRSIEGTGSGTYHAYFEELDWTNATTAQTRLSAFLDDHAPGRREGGIPGEFPAEYSWTMYSKELLDPTSGAWRISDIRPGKQINFSPSTPITVGKNVLIQSVEITHEVDPTQYRYDIRATNHAPIADDLEHFKALAEVPTRAPDTDLFNPAKIPPPVIQFGNSQSAATGEVELYIQVDCGVGRVFRCRYATLTAYTAPEGADLTVDMQYSDDEGTTWNAIFETTDGELVLPDGDNQMETLLGKFSGFPDALDLPNKSIVKCDIKQVGSTTTGAGWRAAIIGEIRDAPVVEEAA